MATSLRTERLSLTLLFAAALPLPPPATGCPDLGPGFGGLLPRLLSAADGMLARLFYRAQLKRTAGGQQQHRFARWLPLSTLPVPVGAALRALAGSREASTRSTPRWLGARRAMAAGKTTTLSGPAARPAWPAELRSGGRWPRGCRRQRDDCRIEDLNQYETPTKDPPTYLHRAHGL